MTLKFFSLLTTFALICSAHADDSIPLDRYAGALRKVTVTIAGADREFLFDTGGGYSLISPGLAQAIRCRPSGRILGFRSTGERFETPLCEHVRLSIGVHSPTETVGVFDLMRLLPKGLPRLAGVISLQSFKGQTIGLDLADGKLRLGTAANGHPFKCRAATGLDGSNYVLFASVERAGAQFWFEIDSGNVDAVRIAPHAAVAFGVDPASRAIFPIDLALGKSASVRVDARITGMLYDGMLSARFLEHGTLFASLSQNPLCRWQPHSKRGASVQP